jgi:hypothetical protein
MLLYRNRQVDRYNKVPVSHWMVPSNKITNYRLRWCSAELVDTLPDVPAYMEYKQETGR